MTTEFKDNERSVKREIETPLAEHNQNFATASYGAAYDLVQPEFEKDADLKDATVTFQGTKRANFIHGFVRDGDNGQLAATSAIRYGMTTEVIDAARDAIVAGLPEALVEEAEEAAADGE